MSIKEITLNEIIEIMNNYDKNCIIYFIQNLGYCLKDYYKCYNCYNFISSAFIWENTPQGQKYWSNANTALRKHINKDLS
jgi:hypothetical protein